MSTLHIGTAGELLVQYLLLKHEIDSARLTTDSGVDLVAYSPITATATTIQVKTVRTPGTAGGKKGGLPNVGWWFRNNCPADVLALALLSTDSAWLFTMEEARELAQQYNAAGNHQLYWYTDPTRVPRNGRQESAMHAYRLENRVGEMFLDRTEHSTGGAPMPEA